MDTLPPADTAAESACVPLRCGLFGADVESDWLTTNIPLIKSRVFYTTPWTALYRADCTRKLPILLVTKNFRRQDASTRVRRALRTKA